MIPKQPTNGAGRRRKFRPDLSDYDFLIMALVDKLNENGLYKMNKTDAVKIAIEKAVKAVLPDVVVKPKRKRYKRLEF